MTSKENDPWPQRVRFRALVDDWIEAHLEPGVARSKVKNHLALSMGMSPNVFKQLYSGVDAPGRVRLNKMASALGIDPTELMDKVEPLAGMPAAEWQAADENTRAFANAVWHEVKDLDPTKRKKFLDLVRAWKE